MATDLANNSQLQMRSGFTTKIMNHIHANGALYLLALPGLVYLIMFMYVPLSGIIVVFKNYNFMDGLWGSPWVGFKNFDFFFYSFDKAWLATRNTLLLNTCFIIFGTAFSVGLAIMFNEIKNKMFNRITQSLSIFPYFFSWAIIGGMVMVFIDYDKGMINGLLESFGLQRYDFNNTPGLWPAILTLANIWKFAGYNCIIYYAVLVGMDTSYYEAADVEGATILQKITQITIPLLKPTIIILTLLSIGRIFYGDLMMMVGLTNLNPMLISTTEIIDSFVYRSVIQNGEFAMGSAVGLYQSIFGFLLVTLANYVVGRFDKDYKIF